MQLIVESIGWIGSALILVSLAQSQPRRLHSLNIGACIVLIAYNALIGAVPGIGLNAGLILVNLWRLRALPRGRTAGHGGNADHVFSAATARTDRSRSAANVPGRDPQPKGHPYRQETGDDLLQEVPSIKRTPPY